MKGKKDSLINTLKCYGGPSCINIQESKLRFPGTFKIPGYQIFEKIRTGLGGGLFTAIDVNLSPMLISSATDDIEILVTQVLIGNHKLRIINAYGPQENEVREQIFSFWQQFEAEIINAKENECFVLIEMDANAKLGAGWIQNDPHKISDNGTLLPDILVRQNVACLNNIREGF